MNTEGQVFGDVREPVGGEVMRGQGGSTNYMICICENVIIIISYGNI